MHGESFEQYALAGKQAGLTRDQFNLLVRYGIVLQPKQLEFVAACFACDVPDGPKDVGFGGARGGGKSHAMLAMLALDCLRFPGLTTLLLRKVGKANRQNFTELKSRVLRGVPSHYNKQEGVLFFDNGSKIVLGHFQRESDIDAYLGLEYDVIATEEATTLTASKDKTVGTTKRSSKIGWRPRRYYSTNPGNVGHAWFKDKFIVPWRRGRQKETRFVPATVDDNLCVNAEYKDELGTLTGWMLRAWRYGDWDIAAGQFFTNFRAEVDGCPYHVLPPFRIPRAWRMWAALDYGWVHYTYVPLGAQDDDGNIYIVDEHAERRWQVPRHADAIKAMLERHGRKPQDLWRFVAGHDVFDKPSEDGTFIEDTYKKSGLTFTRANVNRINGAAEILQRLGDLDAPKPQMPTLFIFSRCQRLIECLPSLEHDPHRAEDVLKVDADDDGLGGDDAYDGLRYLVMEARNPRKTSVLGAGGERTNYDALVR